MTKGYTGYKQIKSFSFFLQMTPYVFVMKLMKVMKGLNLIFIECTMTIKNI
jgi:hypothetical protein